MDCLSWLLCWPLTGVFSLMYLADNFPNSWRSLVSTMGIYLVITFAACLGPFTNFTLPYYEDED